MKRNVFSSIIRLLWGIDWVFAFICHDWDSKFVSLCSIFGAPSKDDQWGVFYGFFFGFLVLFELIDSNLFDTHQIYSVYFRYTKFFKLRPVGASWVCHMSALDLTLIVFGSFLLSGVIRCSRFILYISCPTLGNGIPRLHKGYSLLLSWSLFPQKRTRKYILYYFKINASLVDTDISSSNLGLHYFYLT